jgi:hypothetical protein
MTGVSDFHLLREAKYLSDGSQIVWYLALGPQTSHPVARKFIGLTLHWLLALRRRRIDSRRVQPATDCLGPAHGELVAEDPYRVSFCGVKPVLPVGVEPRPKAD